jgi:hypothetical protein
MIKKKKKKKKKLIEIFFYKIKNGFFDGQIGLVWREKNSVTWFSWNLFMVWKSNITVNRAATHSVRNLNQLCQMFSLPSLTFPCSLFSFNILLFFELLLGYYFWKLLFKTLFLLMFLTLLFLTLIFKTFSFLTILLFLEVLFLTLLLKT